MNSSPEFAFSQPYVQNILSDMGLFEKATLGILDQLTTQVTKTHEHAFLQLTPKRAQLKNTVVNIGTP